MWRKVISRSDRDKQTIESLVRRLGPTSRARIHEVTRIRLSATSQLVRDLLTEGRLVEAGVEDGRLGRKSVLLQLNEQYRSVVGLEFDDECVTAGVTDLRPRVRKVLRERTRLERGQAGLLDQLLCVTRKAMEGEQVIGIGVADPGLVDSKRGITLTSSTMPFWRQVPLGEIFAAEFGVPVLVETRTRAKALAERQGDDEAAATSMIYIDYGSGIGAGLFVDGRLLYGQGSAAGEFGHTHIVEHGPICTCGSFGCLEAIAGLRAVEARVRRILTDGGKTEVLDMADGDPARITGWMVFEAASQGDKVAINVMAEVARYLGLGIANLVNLFNPGLVVLDARLALAGQELLDQINVVVRRQALREATEQVRIRYARVKDGAGVLGVAGIVLDKHYANTTRELR